MYVQIGNYRFPDGMCNLTNYTVQSLRSERGFRKAQINRMHLNFDLFTQQATTANCQADLLAQIDAVIASALSQEDLSVGLFLDNGTLTNHCLLANSPHAMSNVRLVSRGWPRGDPAEFATCRSGEVVFEQIQRRVDREVLSYTETIHVTGTGGPRVSWRETAGGPPVGFETSPVTVVHVVQSGRAVGFDGYVIPPAAMLGYPYFNAENSSQTPGYPTRFEKGWFEWPIEWRYVMTYPGPITLFPSITY